MKLVKREQSMKNIQYDYIKSMRELIDYAAEKYKDKPAIQYIVKDEVISKSYNELRLDVYSLSSFLYNQDIQQKNIAILGDISYQWVVSYYGIVCCGAVVVPIDKQLPIEDVIILLSKAKVKCVIFDKIYEKYINMIQSRLPDIECFISMNETSEYKTLAEILSMDKLSYNDKFTVNGDSLASIVFTSGTTGSSKGVMLTHKNICDNMICCYYFLGLYGFKTTIPLLPVHHMFEFTVGIQYSIYVGMTICIGKGIKYIKKSIDLFKPDFLILVPQILEMFHKQIWMEANKNKQDKKLKIAMTISKCLLAIGIDIRKKLFKNIQDFFGGNLRVIASGGAPLRDELVQEFLCFGITLINGYGITECSPVVSCNFVDDIKLGSIGRVAPKEYCKVKIVDGEILVSGSIVMKGYYDDPQSTAEVFDGEWLKTGDIGHIDSKGYLFITGRKKNLIILDNGENVSPEELELYYKQLDLVKEIMVYEKKNKKNQVIAATIVPDYEYAQKNGIDDIKGTLENEIAKMNNNLPNYKKVQLIEIKEEEFIKTTTGKIKRYILEGKEDAREDN